MKMLHPIGPAVLLGLLALAGCQDRGAKPSADAAAEGSKEPAAAQLSPEDQRLADAQRTCPVTGEALGEMGTPVKVTLKGRPVFLCCDGCTKKALANPDKTLAKLEKMKAEAKPLAPSGN